MKFARPKAWLSEEDSPPTQALHKAFEVASKVLSQQYDGRKNDTVFEYRNEFWDQETLKAINEGLRLALEFGLSVRVWSQARKLETPHTEC